MKKIMMLFLLAIFLLPLIGQAHTTLSSSTPAEGSVVVEPLEDVVLTFGTVIEQGSSMTLESADSSYEFDEITISDNVATGTITEDLPNTDYTIHWEIIGADGHPIKGEVPFTLNVKAIGEDIASEAAEETDEAKISEPTTEDAPVEEEKAAQTSEDNGNPVITIFIALTLLVIAFIAYRLLTKKKK